MSRHYVIGILAGWALWSVLVAIDFAYAASISYVPKLIRNVADVVVTVVGLAAWPVALGGWFVWGEGSHLSLPLNVVVGLVLYGTLGVIAAAIYARRQAT